MNDTVNTGTHGEAVHPAVRNGAAERVHTGETVARLQRGILRLALAYHGRNPALDAKLKELGGLLRSGRRDAQLQSLIDEIVDTIVSLDLDAAKPGDADESQALMIGFLDRLELPGKAGQAVGALRELLAGKRAQAEILTQIENAAGAIRESLDSGDAPSSEDLETPRHMLIELIERIAVPATLAVQATSLRHTILAAEDTSALKSAVGGLADLVADIRSELQAEIDNLTEFLRRTSQRLNDFEKYMTHSRSLHADASSEAVQLSETINGSVDALKDDVNGSDDLDDVKHLIENQLDSINEDLSRFVSQQQKRTSEASDTIDKMVHKLQDLEKEAEHLRSDLEEQHARVLIDPLTGILNRSGYLETAGKQFARWKRYGGALSLAVIDLDLFKHINDKYGHAAGDKVLATVAAKLNERIRDADILCRYGGEEFVLILPETTGPDAVGLLNQLRVEIEACPFRYKDTPVPVTLSCGVAQFHKSETLESVFERADGAMYEAKSRGRNQVCEATGEAGS